MTTTREVREGLAALLEGKRASKAEVREGLSKLLNEIARHDEKPFEEVLAMLAVAQPPRTAKPKRQLSATVAELRELLMDDARFAMAVKRLADDKSATKAFLTDVYLKLFRRNRGIRATAPRDEIVQLILDERNVLRRHGTLEALTRPEPVAAE